MTYLAIQVPFKDLSMELVCFLLFICLLVSTSLFTWGERISVEKMPPSDWPVAKSEAGFLCGRAQHTVGGATPGQGR